MFGGLYEYIFGCTHDYKIVFVMISEPNIEKKIVDNYYIRTICKKCNKIRCQTVISKQQYDYNVMSFVI